METRASFTEHVRQELANLELHEVDAWAELAGLARCGGRLLRSGGGAGWAITIPTTSGAVARRAYALMRAVLEVRPEIAVRAPGGVQPQTTYEVRLAGHASAPMRLGLLGPAGRPRAELPLEADDERVPDLLRGAILACASFSTPGRDPHLEFSPGPRHTAEALAGLLRHHLVHQVSVLGEDRPRVVVKSGEAIGDVLVLVGAMGAFLRWDERRMRRQLRGEATRLANADAANLRRSTSAAASQIRAVERVLAERGWEELDDELREVALVRLANPEASLQELGTLLDPPVGKSAVHRRLHRLMALDDPA